MMPPQVFKSEILFDQLKNELSGYLPGDKFITNREIMKRFGVSQLVVDQTMSRLREAGLLQVVAGRGSFVTETVEKLQSSPPATLLFAVPYWNSSDLTLLEQFVASYAGGYHGFRLLVHRYNHNEMVPENLPLTEENVTGVAISASSTPWNSTIISRLEEYASKVPLVIMHRHRGDLNFLAVGGDDVFAGNLAADHLYQHGHHKVAILISEPHNDIIQCRVHGVINYAKLHKMEYRIIDCNVQYGEYAPDKAYRTFEQVIRDGIDFTGLIGISTDSFVGAVNAGLNLKLRFPEDLSLVTVGLKRIAAIQHPPLDCVDSNLDGQYEAILEILSNPGKFSPQNNPYEYFTPSVVSSGSTRMISPTI